MMTTLRKARESGKLDQFAKDHDTDAPGDETAFNATLQSMAGDIIHLTYHAPARRQMACNSPIKSFTTKTRPAATLKLSVGPMAVSARTVARLATQP